MSDIACQATGHYEDSPKPGEQVFDPYEAPLYHIPEYMTVKDPDYQECLREGTPILFKTPDDERDFYIMLGWNAAVSAMKGEIPDVI